MKDDRTVISRKALITLTLSFLLVYIPLAGRIDLIIALLAPFPCIWRFLRSFRMVAPLHRWARLAITLTAIAVIGGYFAASRSSLNLFIDLLAGGTALKFLEYNSSRDVFYHQLGIFFLAGLVLVFNTGIVMVLFLPAVVFLYLLTAVFLESSLGLRGAVKVGGTIALEALPLAIAIFIFMPRIAPFWNAQVGDTSKSGFTTEVSADDLGRIIQSDRMVMRVAFDRGTELPESLYFRTAVYPVFDGRSWKMSRPAADFVHGITIRMPFMVNTPGPRLTGGKRGGYSIIMEPGMDNFLPTLLGSAECPSCAYLRHEDLWLSKRRVLQKESYRFSIFAGIDRSAEKPQYFETRLRDAGNNPRTRELARRIRAEAASPADAVSRFLGFLKSGGFVYTLDTEPDRSSSSIDNFLFSQKAGYCSHYASATAYVLRAMGIPSRLVGGFVGGTMSQDGDYLTVRENNAHVWVEAWYDNSWQEIDPTAIINSSVIERGADLVAADPAAMGLTMRAYTWMKNLMDDISYKWASLVVNYGLDEQPADPRSRYSGYLEKLVKAGIIIIGFILLTMLAVLLISSRKKGDPVAAEISRFEQRIASAFPGMERETGETVRDFAERAAEKSTDENASVIRKYWNVLYDFLYRGTLAKDEALRTLKGLRMSIRRGAPKTRS